jgi:hypothetical protein
MTKLLTRLGFFVSLSFISVELSGQYTSPYIDVRSYHVRATAPYSVPAIPGITANCTATSATLPISNASSFINGDGVTVFGCGPANNVTPPTGLAVTPSVASGPLAIPNATVAGPAGSTSYCYTIIARDKPGGLTAAPTQVCTSTGAASLGVQNVAVSGWTRSGTVVTATTAAPHGLAVGSMVYMSTVNNTADNYNFGGWFNVATVPDNSHFTYNTGLTVANGAASVSNGGGTAIYYNCNHLSWTSQPNAFQYYIYGRTNGRLTYIGTSRVQSTANNLTPDTTFDDYGSAMMNGAVAPYFVPTTPPVSVLADPLVTTIVSGGGTTTLTLASPASASVRGATILFDNTPNIQTAASHTQFGSLLYFPANANGYVVNSYLTLPGAVAVHLAGANLTLNDTMQISSGDKFFGMLGAQSTGALSFGFPIGATVTVANANPGIYASAANSSYWHGIEFNVSNNQGNAILLDDAGNSSFNFLEFAIPGLMSIGFIERAADFFTDFDHIAVIGGQSGNGSSATPGFLYSGGDVTFSNISLSGRSITKYDAVAGPGVEVTVNGNSREQAGVMPFFTLYVGQNNEGGSLTFNNIELDTMSHAVFALMGPGSTTGNISFQGGSGPVSGFGWVTGKPGPFITGTPVQLGHEGYNTSTISAYNFYDSPVNVSGIGEFMVPIINTAAPGVTVSAGGNVPVGTACFAITMVDVNGQESTLSPNVCVAVTSRNQKVTITPPVAPAGAVGWLAYRGGSGGANDRISEHCFIASAPFGTAVIDATAFSCGHGAPRINRAGSQSLSAAGLSGTGINVLGGGFKNALSFNGTANRKTVLPDLSGSPVSTVGYDSQARKTSAQTPKSLTNPATGLALTVGANDTLFRADVALACDLSSANATVLLTILYTDVGNTAQSQSTTTANCTTLGAASVTSQAFLFMAKAGSSIQYSTTIVNTPSYDVRISLQQLGIN